MPSPLVKTVTDILSILTVAGDIIVVVLLVTLIMAIVTKRQNALFRFIGQRGILYAFIVALIATLGSLFFSEVAKYTPCKLCWFQRIFMYPQTILLGIALIKKERLIWVYSLVLSFIGGLIAAYHYYIQVFGSPFAPCSADGVSCTEKIILHFGYITIPMMSLTAFLMIILYMIFFKMWLTRPQETEKLQSQ